eukprot:UN04096
MDIGKFGSSVILYICGSALIYSAVLRWLLTLTKNCLVSKVTSKNKLFFCFLACLFRYYYPTKTRLTLTSTVYFFFLCVFFVVFACVWRYIFLYTSVGCGLSFTFCPVQSQCNSVAMWTLV